MFQFVYWLRALAAILITNSHYADIWPASAMAFGGHYGNCIYFFLSGFCLYNIGKSFPKWYAKRIVRTRLKNVMTGAVLERTFSPTDKYPTAHIETREMQYLYTDGDLYYFMDNESYEQLALNHEQVEDAIDFVVENSNVTIRFYKGNAFSVAAPNFVELTVTATEPGFKGDTATGTTKPAVLETGYKIAVPLFVNEGDRIRVDTRTGEYMERC